jgi:hypothetical protein
MARNFGAGEEIKMSNGKPTIGIILGDPAGIGPEIAIRGKVYPDLTFR